MSNPYNHEGERKTTSFLTLGISGSGKSVLLSTCPKPIVVLSFDPTGWESYKKLVWSKDNPDGTIFVDSRYEVDKPKAPTAFKMCEAEINRLHAKGIFEKIGTFGIDSGTNFINSLLYEVARQEGHTGDIWLDDYKKAGIYLISKLQEIIAFPCHFYMTGHLEIFKDELQGGVHSSIMAPGRMKTTIPGLFSEIYICQTEVKQDGTAKYTLSTVGTRTLVARTRIGRDVFKPIMEPNIQAMLKQVGYDWEDKPNPPELMGD